MKIREVQYLSRDKIDSQAPEASDIIVDEGHNGYKYCGFMPYYTKSGNLISFDLIFKKADTIIDYCFEEYSTSNVFGGYDDIITAYEIRGHEFVGYYPFEISQCGNISKVNLVFVEN